MQRRNLLRVITTVGLFPLWLLGVYAGLLMGILFDLTTPRFPRWQQPPGANRVVDIRISESSRLHRCAVLAQTTDRDFYLYALPSSGTQTMRVIDVTDDYEIAGLPPAFAVKSLQPLQLERVVSPQNARAVQSAQLAHLPSGTIVTSGHCYVWFEMWSEELDAVVVKESGLWIAWQEGGGNELDLFLGELLLSIGGSAIVMTVIVAWLYRRIWREK